MLAWAIEHRRNLPVEDGSPVALSTGSLDNDPQHIAVLERLGFQRTEHYSVPLV